MSKLGRALKKVATDRYGCLARSGLPAIWSDCVAQLSEKADFGIEGLDDITVGGLARGRLILLEGSPGTGKTTIATQFLMAGARAGERTLYITLSETEEELRAGAASHGWDLPEGLDVFELVPPESLLDVEHQHGGVVVREIMFQGED